MRKCYTCKNEYECYGQRRNICRPCKQAYDREYHAKRSSSSKKSKLSKQKDRLLAGRQFLWDYLKENPCVNCGESNPVVLDFDHLDQTKKNRELSVMVGFSIDNIKKEIEKCRVLCSNCHRIHTAEQLGWYSGVVK